MFIMLGALSSFFAVALGAFGAHGLKTRLTEDLIVTYQTAVEYHFYHSLGLILIGVFSISAPQIASLKYSGYTMLAGSIIFSGSLYLLALTGIRWLGAVTPIGGVLLLIAWVLLAWSAYQFMASVA